MKYQGRNIDHIVYCVPNLEEAIDHIELKLGARPQIGGRHLNKGTKNALLNLGNECYLEILAVDEENKDFDGARWMGIDLITKPCITRWGLKTENLDLDKRLLMSYDPKLGQESQGERLTLDNKVLNWKMLLPEASPLVELAPFVLDWSESEQHPTAALSEECLLEHIAFNRATRNTKILSYFDTIFSNFSFNETNEDQILITIKGPKGTLQL